MRSSDVQIHFPLIKTDEALAELKRMTYNFSSIIDDYSKLSDEQRASFEYPSYVSRMRSDIINGRYGKDCADYRNINTFLTGMGILRSCAQINNAIHALEEKYSAQESKNHYRYASYSSFSSPSWYNSSDPEVLAIKNQAIAARDKIHNFSKKYTVEGFEENFINKVKYSVYVICNRFMVDTRTLGQKTEDASINIFARIVVYGGFFLLFFLVGKCATGQ